MHPQTYQKMNGQSGSRVIALIPAFNEERFIGSVVLKTRRYVDQVLVVDDGSSDATALIAEAAGATVVRHPHNQGKGAALNTGFFKARELGASTVIMLDADGQHLPRELEMVARPVLEDGADLVIGSRYLQHTSRVPRHRILGHQFFNFVTNVASGSRATDSQSGFRAFSKRAVELISFSSNGFSVESEMQFLANQHNLKLTEVPITIEYKDAPKRSVVRHGLAVLNGILRLVGQYRPLLFFGGTGLVLLLGGLLWGLKVINILDTTGQLAVGSAILSAIFGIVGILSLSTGIILHSIRALLISFNDARSLKEIRLDP